MCKKFELVCNNQSSKAFESAAAYLVKGMKETSNNETKLIHKAKSVTNTEWRCYIKSYLPKRHSLFVKSRARSFPVCWVGWVRSLMDC